MTAVARVQMTPRAPRTQAQRSAETRARIKHAVVQSIDDVGFQRTTASAIARRAGMTWGAVQHHFGGKDGILAAVIEDSFSRFADRFEDFPVTASVDERVAMFIERAWEHFGSAHYRTTFEILLHYLPQHRPREMPTLQARMLGAWDRLWTRLFGDSALPRAQRLVLERYTISSLSGLAINLVLQGRNRIVPRGELDLLRATLIRALRRGGTVSQLGARGGELWRSRHNAKRASRNSRR
ncbi:MAG TPA: TetR/AcrR family transcriptional regulator [Candidatus Binatia bacterium]|nr:TetR/AcrR family transcriptional regulator [Candidatus Binatia bacterium]